MVGDVDGDARVAGELQKPFSTALRAAGDSSNILQSYAEVPACFHTDGISGITCSTTNQAEFNN